MGRNGFPGLVAVALCAAATSLFAQPAPKAATTLFIEAESAEVNAADKTAVWTVGESGGASGGKALVRSGRGLGGESPGIPVNVAVPGDYRVWVRHFKKAAGATNLLALVRDESGQVMGFARLDWAPRTSTETPYEKPQSPHGDKTGFVWESLGVTFERPTSARVCFGGGVFGQAVDCLLLTTDRSLDPAVMDVAALPSLANAPTDPPFAPPAPAGFLRSPGLPARIDAFAGVDDPDRRFWSGIINVGALYVDGAYMIRMGFNRDHNRGSYRWGIRSLAVLESLGDPAFAKAHPSPEGRFVNAQGQVGQMFSLHYPPRAEAEADEIRKRVRAVVESGDEAVGFWRTSSEEGGWLDYSTYAQEAFRKWLAAKHGTIEALNRRWGATYARFEEIVPAKSYEEGRASWLEFREFSGNAYAESVARRIAVVHALDPQHRPCLGANSNLDIAAPYFMAFRPNDWSEFIRVGLREEKYVSFDIYCADDDMAHSIEFLTSFSGGRKLINQEFSNHAVDPRIAARTYWVQVAKGVHGINLFNFQEGEHATYPKWALLSRDGSPKFKLAAYSDAAQEVHRLEPLLMSAAYTHAVKPVALYWSRIDLGLDKPQDSWYGHGLNSPVHVYATLRSLGYAVRWITPRQIAEGGLDQVGALVMAGCNHVPLDAARRIEQWVHSGGAVIADSWPGAFDEYGRPQATLAPLFGVRPAVKKPAKEGSLMAIQESRQGYGEVTDAASLRERLYEKVEETAQQPNATHPVALAMGDFMLTGIALDRVECVAGKVISMTHRSPGWPGFVVNDYGMGKTLYSALLLGTVYESAPVRYEWDTTHSGLSYGRLLDAFLRYACVAPAARTMGMTPRVAAKLRVESPLVTPEGNVLIGLTSMNDDVVEPFDLEVVLPPGQTDPFLMTLVATGGGRRLERGDARISGSKLRLRMPSFDTHAMVLALRDAKPLVALDLKGVERGPAGLAWIDPGQEFEVAVTIYNPSREVLEPGCVTLTVPVGWLQSVIEAGVPRMAPGTEARCTLRIRALELAGQCRLEPLSARFDNGVVKSTPATEMLWWGMK